MKKILNSLFTRLDKAARSQIEQFGAPCYIFIIFAILNYLIPLFMLDNITPPIITLRFIAILLCISLFFIDYWPNKWKITVFPIYWYFCLWFCLPFVSIYTGFLLRGSETWVLNGSLALLLLLMLVDWNNFIILILTSTAAAYSLYLANPDLVPVQMQPTELYFLTYLSAFIIISTFIFLKTREAGQKEKIEIMKIFGGAIAHEVNSPLAAIRMLIGTFQEIGSNWQKKAKKIEKNGESYYSISNITANEFEMLTKILPEHLAKVAQEASKIVDILLISLREQFGNNSKLYYISEVVKEVLRDHESSPRYQNIKFNYQNNHDFLFVGSKQMIKNIIQNLIRNSFQHGGEKVKIKIWLENNCLHFKDNGRGISPKNLKTLFKSFHTTSENGNGIGLAFCSTVMKIMGGSIECHSIVDQYAEFILTFPRYGLVNS